MADETVEVEVTVPTSTDTDTGSSTDSVTTEHVIDAAIETGVAAGAAKDDADSAADSEFNARMDAQDANRAAEDANQAANVSLQTLDALQTLTQQNVELLALIQGQQSQQLGDSVSNELPDAEVLNPEIDIEPESVHWLQRRVFPNPFARKKA